MQKIIENVLPQNEGGTSWFFGAVSSMHLSVLSQSHKIDNPNQKHQFIFHVLYAVSGAGMFRLHQSNIPHFVVGYNADEMNSFVSDYISYSLSYLGYDFKKFTPGETAKETIYSEITVSIDKKIPILFKAKDSIQWNVICGYDTSMNLYGVDAKNHHARKYTENLYNPEGYLDNGYFYDSKWYDSLEYVLICNPVNKTIPFKSTLSRMCSSLENHLSSGFNANILLLKNNDSFFVDKEDDFLKNLYSYVDSVLGYLMECSNHVSEAFGAVWKSYLDNPNVNPQIQDVFSTLDGVISNTQATVWKHWNYKPDNGIEKYTLLKTQNYRNTLLSYLYDISEDDKKALKLIQQAIELIGDDYFDLSV